MSESAGGITPEGNGSIDFGMEGNDFFVEPVGGSLVPENPCDVVAIQESFVAEQLIVGDSAFVPQDCWVGADDYANCETSANATKKSSGFGEEVECGDTEIGDDAVSTVPGAGWTRRVRLGKAPPARERNPARTSALEASIRDFAERKTGSVINPVVGMNFDSLEEAYDFYNLYSWEKGFGIRYAKSRLNVLGVKCMQEIVCGCAAMPLADNSRSTRCGCKARIRLLRTGDNGWYISEHKDKHNHNLSRTCGERKHWFSHKHIDRYTKDLVKQLRENNISLSKVYSVIGSFFGSVDNIPFTKRTLKNLCGKLSRTQADDDATKTIDLFHELRSADKEFNYSVQVDSDCRVKTLMWTTGQSCHQYKCFPDVVTFDTTYRKLTTDGGVCDTVRWVDGEWIPTLERALLKVWKMYDDENASRISGNVQYSTANYNLVLEKRELESRVVQMHKELGRTLPADDAAKMMRDLEHEKNMRKVAEDEVLSLLEEKKKLELYLSDIHKTDEETQRKVLKNGENHLSAYEAERIRKLMAAEKNIRKLADDQVLKLRKESEKRELYITELHKIVDELKMKVKKIGDICAA